MTNTPWGIADHREQIAEGIVFYSTPGHGGFKLSRERDNLVAPKYRDFAFKWSKGWGHGWYEEDCAALAVIVTFPEYFPTANIEQVTELLERYIDDSVGD